MFRTLTQYLVEAPSASCQPRVEALHTWIFCHSSLQTFSSSVRLDGDRQWTAIFRLQICLIDWVQVGAPAWQFKDIHRVVPKSLLRCFAWVLRVIVLLEDEPLAQSEILSALDQVFNKDISVLCSVQLSLSPDQSSRLCRMMLPPPCFTVGTVLCR